MMITLASLASAVLALVAGFAAGVLWGRRTARSADCRGCLTDPVTGRFNRRAIDATLLAYGLGDEPFAALVVDLDKFKLVNDTLGHKVGDLALIEAGRRLAVLVAPDRGMVGRLGGDEFALVALGDADAGRRLAKAAHRVLTQPIVLDGVTVTLSASVGLAHVRPEQAGAALRAADLAMYVAKSAGGGTAERSIADLDPVEVARPAVWLRETRGLETSLGAVSAA